MKTKLPRYMKSCLAIFSGCLMYFLCGPVFSQTEYNASEMRDPFEIQLPHAQAVEQKAEEAVAQEQEVIPPPLVVKSLVAGGPVPQAIINDKIFRIGDEVEEAHIANITKEGVQIVYQEKTFLIPAPSKLLNYTQGGNDAK